MGGKYSTKNTKEVMTAGTKVGAFLIKQIKSKGYRLREDVEKLVKSEEFQQAVLDAVMEITAVPDELGELDFLDYYDLSKHSVVCGLDLLDAAKAPVEA